MQDFVARHGQPGMGALTRLLGQKQLSISTSIGALKTFVAEAKTLIFHYPKAIAAKADNSTIADRFEQVFTLDEKLGRLQTLLKDDPLLQDKERESGLKQVEQSRQQLVDLLHFVPLKQAERQALVDQLEAGWTTSWERRAIEALEQIKI